MPQVGSWCSRPYRAADILRAIHQVLRRRAKSEPARERPVDSEARLLKGRAPRLNRWSRGARPVPFVFTIRPAGRIGFAGSAGRPMQEAVMASLYSHPFGALLDFQNALDQLRSSNWLGSGPSAQGAYPPLNVFRKGDDVVMIIEVPGVKKSDLRIEAKGRTFRIAGSKAVGHDDKASAHRLERRSGLRPCVTLPIEIDAEGIKAECRDGILALFVPRAESDKPRSISIT